MRIHFAGPVDLHKLGISDLPPVHSFPFTGELINEWRAHGHRISLCVLSEHARKNITVEREGVEVTIVPLRRPRDRIADLYLDERRQLARSIEAARSDVISAHWTYEYALAALAVDRSAYVTAHDTPLRYAFELRDPYRAMKNSMALGVVRRVRNMSCVSPYTRNHFVPVVPSSVNIILTPNGVDTRQLQKRSQLEAAAADALVTILNGWSRIKNAKAAIRAFACLRRDGHLSRMIMIGNGYEPGGPAETWAHENGLSGGISYFGPRSHSETMQILRTEAAVLLHPSRLEAHPLTVLEAMALGVPVVGGRRSGGVAWCLDEGWAGGLCDVTDAASICECVRLAVGPGQSPVTRRAWQRVRHNFNLEMTAARYIAWFNS